VSTGSRPRAGVCASQGGTMPTYPGDRGKKTVLHLFPPGILRKGVPAISATACPVAAGLIKENDELEAAGGGNRRTLRISEACH